MKCRRVPSNWDDESAKFEEPRFRLVALDGAVNKRVLSTGETGEFASESVGVALNPRGPACTPAMPLFKPERTPGPHKPAECCGYGRTGGTALLSTKRASGVGAEM
jgi:hypothetical protein